MIKARRKENRTTQGELANMFALSRFTIVDAESGKGDPKLSTVVKLLNGLGLQLVADPNELVT